jgi:hypothetical protein
MSWSAMRRKVALDSSVTRSWINSSKVMRCTSARSAAAGTITSMPAAAMRGGNSSGDSIVYAVPTSPSVDTPRARHSSRTTSTMCTSGTSPSAACTAGATRCIVLAQMPTTRAPAPTSDAAPTAST